MPEAFIEARNIEHCIFPKQNLDQNEIDEIKIQEKP